MNKNELITSYRQIKNTARRGWEGIFGKTKETLRIEAEWEKQMGDLFAGDRITMTPNVRAKHQSGAAWLAHLARQRILKQKPKV